MTKRTIRRGIVLAGLAGAIGLLSPELARADEQTAPAAGRVSVTAVNVEYEGTKMWLPGTIVVPKGATVTVKLINNVPSDPAQHGFAIPAYGIAAVVNRGETATVEFKADRAGVFPIACHLHPAHVGGQLVVLPQ